MKVVILAGGYGTRLGEATSITPKPMVEIGGKPILWHIMKTYSTFGFNEFIILLGYKGYAIKEYFTNYFLHQSSVQINLENNDLKFFDNKSEPWKVILLETGLNTMTGGRIKRIQNRIDETFCLTYGDGVSDVNIRDLISFHNSKKSLATLTAIHPPERFGVLNISGEYVTEFHEKHRGESSWINGGFFVFEPKIFDYLLDGDSTILEKKPLETLAHEQNLTAFKHNGFWHPMDTLRDKNYLENLWFDNKANWKIW